MGMMFHIDNTDQWARELVEMEKQLVVARYEYRWPNPGESLLINLNLLKTDQSSSISTFQSQKEGHRYPYPYLKFLNASRSFRAEPRIDRSFDSITATRLKSRSI